MVSHWGMMDPITFLRSTVTSAGLLRGPPLRCFVTSSALAVAAGSKVVLCPSGDVGGTGRCRKLTEKKWRFLQFPKMEVSPNRPNHPKFENWTPWFWGFIILRTPQVVTKTMRWIFSYYMFKEPISDISLAVRVAQNAPHFDSNMQWWWWKGPLQGGKPRNYPQVMAEQQVQLPRWIHLSWGAGQGSEKECSRGRTQRISKVWCWYTVKVIRFDNSNHSTEKICSICMFAKVCDPAIHTGTWCVCIICQEN